MFEHEQIERRHEKCSTTEIMLSMKMRRTISMAWRFPRVSYVATMAVFDAADRLTHASGSSTGPI
eukprot:scaffold23141_cov133-Skeletonema_marinoi.AAC.3